MNTMVVAGAKVAGGVALVVLNLWVAQHLSPAAYGAFALAITCMLLMDGVVGSAFDAATLRAEGEAPGSGEMAGLALKLGAGAAVTAVGALAFSMVAPESSRLAVMTGLAATGMFVHRSALLRLQMRERFGWYAAADLAHTAARCACAGAGVAAGVATATTMTGAYAMAAWGSAAVFLAFAWRGSRPGPGPALERVAAYGLLTLSTTGVGAVVARLDLLILGAVGDPAETGIFAASATLALLPMWLGAYLAPAFTARILPYARDGRLQDLFSRVQPVLIGLGVAGTLAGISLAPTVTRALLPHEYQGAAQVLPVLLLAGAAGFVTFPLVLHTLLFLSPRTYLAMDLVSLPVLVPAYLLAADRWGAVGVASVTGLSAVVKAAIATATALAVVRRAGTAALVEA